MGLVWRLSRRVLAGMREEQFVDIDLSAEPSTAGATDGGIVQHGQAVVAQGAGAGASIKETVLKMSSPPDAQDESELLPPSNEKANRWTQACVTRMGSLPNPAEEPTAASAGRPNGRATGFLFAVHGKAKRDRAHTAKCWGKALDNGITGHSARRS